MLVEHLERWLGQMVGGWRVDDPQFGGLAFQVFRHGGNAVPQSAAYVTVGVNRYLGGRSLDGHPISQELMLLLPDDLVDADRAAFDALADAGFAVLRDGPFLRGQVVPTRAEPLLAAGKPFLYVTLPVFFDDRFAVAHQDGQPVVIAWVVPVTAAEQQYVTTYGWEAFEALLLHEDPDLVDLYRPSAV